MKKLKKIWMGALSVALLSLAFLGIFSHKSLAAPITTFVPRQAWQIDHVSLKFGPDRSTIIATFPEDTIGGQRALGGTVTFKDGDTTDNTFRYTPTTPFCNTGSHGGIWFNENGATTIGPTIKVGDTVKAYVDLDYLPDTAILDTSELGSCNNTTDGNQPNGNNVLDVTGASVLNDTLQWDPTDHATLRAIGPLGGNDLALDSKNYVFTPTGTDSIMRNGTDPCAAVAVISADNSTANIYVLYAVSSAGSTIDWTQVPELQSLANNEPNQTCYVGWADSVSNPKTSDINNLTPYDIAGSRVPPSKGGVGSGAATTTGASDTQGCAISSDFNWILCPVITGLSNAADSITGIVEGQLNFNIGANLGKTGGSVEKAWTVFKNLVSALLVIVMLVMVISQAVGGGIFEPYTVKKLLPKLVVAIIAMQLSWVICIWLIGLANDAGQGIAQLLAAPFGGQAELTLPNLIHRLSAFWGATVGITTTAIAGGAIVSSFLFGTAILAYGWPVLVLAAISIFITLIVALATLLFRNALIVFLVIMSPLAFLALVLPGTNKYWKMWKDNFSKLLIFFPLVMSMIYGGRIFAWIAGNLGGADPLDLIMVLVGFFGPYFFLPKAFKWGGSALALVNKGINESWPIKKGREVANRELGFSSEEAAGKRKQRALIDSQYKHLRPEDRMGPEAWNKLSAGERLRSRLGHYARNGAIRTLGGHPIPTARSTWVMDKKTGEWKQNEIALMEGKMNNDYKEFQKMPGVSVQEAKERTRDKYWDPTKKGSLSNRAFLTWARDTSSFLEMGQPEWRMGGHNVEGTWVPPGITWNPDTKTGVDSNGNTVDKDGLAEYWNREKDMVKTQDWIDWMHGSPDAYRDVGQRLGAFVPYRLPNGGGPKASEFLAQAGGNQHKAELLADSERFFKTIDQAEDPGAIPAWRPEHFEELRKITKELGGLEHSRGAQRLKLFIDDQSQTLAGRNLLQRLSGSAEEHIDAMFDSPGYLQAHLVDSRYRGGGEEPGTASAPARPRPSPDSGGGAPSGGAGGFSYEASAPRRSGESGSFHTPGLEGSPSSAGGTRIDHQLNETLQELTHVMRQNTAAIKEVRRTPSAGVGQPIRRGPEWPSEGPPPEPGEEIRPRGQQ